jgi:hypothetical protein
LSSTISDLIDRLVPDPWRTEVGFSNEIEETHRTLFDPNVSLSDHQTVINNWIANYQPCLFGKLAARLNLLSYCILTEKDLSGSEESLREKIQSARTEWKRQGFQGMKSGFVICVISQAIARCIPDDSVKTLAMRLCNMYLLDEILPDRINLDELFLEMPGPARTTWKWDTGVNYFSAHGDKRWWHDHRFPGGLAFSVNSVGHMIKSGVIAKHITELAKLMGAPKQDLIATKVDSPEDALLYAMLTIDNAADAVSGRATELLPANQGELPISECPVKLPKILEGKNFCEYIGYYHTDFTIPSEYFTADIARPAGRVPYHLDFTYLIDEDSLSTDRLRLKEGVRIRGIEIPSSAGIRSPSERFGSKRRKAHGREVRSEAVPRNVSDKEV